MNLQKLFPAAADREANQQHPTADTGEAAAMAGTVGSLHAFAHLQASKLTRSLVNGYGWMALWERIKGRGLAQIVLFEVSMVQMALCLEAMAGLAHEQ